MTHPLKECVGHNISNTHAKALISIRSIVLRLDSQMTYAVDSLSLFMGTIGVYTAAQIRSCP